MLLLSVIIMSRKSFRVNPHPLVFLNVKELLARSSRHIWSLSGSNVIRTYNHLVHKRPIWLNGWVFVYELPGCGFESRCCHLCSYIYEFWLVHTCFRHRPRHKCDVTCLGNLCQWRQNRGKKLGKKLIN